MNPQSIPSEPNGSFKNGKIESSLDEKEDWEKYKKVGIDINAKDRSPRNNYKLFTSTIVPRPIGFVSTVSKDGKYHNLAPFSCFQVVSSNPIVFSLGISKNTGHVKDTCRNLQETGECTINMVSEWMIEAVNYGFINAPPNVSEWDLSGLTPVDGHLVKSPHVLESPMSVECKVIHDIPMFHPRDKTRETGNVFLLEAIYVHAREDLFDESDAGAFGNVLLSKLKPVCRLGGITYGRTVHTFEIPKVEIENERSKKENKELIDKLLDMAI